MLNEKRVNILWKEIWLHDKNVYQENSKRYIKLTESMSDCDGHKIKPWRTASWQPGGRRKAVDRTITRLELHKDIFGAVFKTRTIAAIVAKMLMDSVRCLIHVIMKNDITLLTEFFSFYKIFLSHIYKIVNFVIYIKH